ncbi:hypothetical protein [Shewanella fidelis]|uniref:TonB C-terminal domain-containing protein n=1 Tax=Shewanella fidelis TaxID=173509 RepID=A0AAW8NT96_9GAMM|nr:hypothetical protein [Shewanella fidelis]MDR8526177.1 hypothetical protein [Shewanella fidelis]MDW4813790.1 hypothetical protein [Shewanella fidelis]MDW4817886.1 hypothetical protein [Shewanella fidelis]MDW4821853.1 hypothetical protein [Shewanella fidelis]MDW4826118.1 hypothetical protein [Shewanella fidelis]
MPKIASLLATMIFVVLGNGCANHGSSQNTNHIIDIDSSEIAYYWIAQEGLINWQNFLPSSDNGESWESANYNVSFVVDPQGKVQQVSMQNTMNGDRIANDNFREISQYRFVPTARNITQQAVRVNSVVKL